MSGVSLENQVLLQLASGDPDSALPVSLLSDALSLPAGRVSRRIELVSTLEELVERGHVRRLQGTDSPSEAPTFQLTDEGRAIAEERRREVAGVTVRMPSGKERECTLREAAVELDRALVDVAVDLTSDGVYRQVEVEENRFVDRESERDRILDRLETVRSERTGRLVLVTGPPGVGKTTLVEWFLDTAREQGAEVVRARSQPTDGPYQPLKEAITAVDREHAGVFEDSGPPVDDPGELEAQQAALFADASDALEPSPDGPPRILFVDDLHFADPGTLSYLEYWLGRRVESPLLLIGSYRKEQIPSSALPDADSTAGTVAVDTIDLEPFDREHTREAIESTVGRTAPPETFVDVIHDHTGGNPLFVGEAVEMLLETKQLDPLFEWYPETTDTIDVPDQVQATLEQRLENFSPRARDLLRWIAIAGEDVSVDTLRDVVDLTAGTVSVFVSLFEESDLLERTGTRNAVRFRSDVVRRIVTNDLEEGERRRRHAAIAETLEASFEEPPGAFDEVNAAVTTASHYRRAERPERAIEWYQRAGDGATAVYAHETALEYFESALTLAREHAPQRTVFDIAERLIETNVTVGEYEPADRYAKYVAERTTDPELSRRMYYHRSHVASSRGDPKQGLALAREGLEMSPEDASPSKSICELLDAQGMAERQLASFDEARSTAKRQLELAEEIGEPELAALAAEHLGTIAFRQSDFETARQYHTRSRDIRRDLGDRHGLAKSHRSLGLVAWKSQNLETAREQHERSLELYREVGDRHGVTKALGNLALTVGKLGELDRKSELLEECLERFREVGDRHGVAKTLTNLANTYIDQREFDAETVKQHLQESLAIKSDVGDRHGVMTSYNNLGRVHRAVNSFERSQSAYEESLQIAQELDDKHAVAVNHKNLAAVGVGRSAYESARSHVETCLPTFEELEMDRHIAECHALLGTTALRQARFEEARSQLLESRARYSKHENQEAFTSVLGDLGFAEWKCGAASCACRYLTESLELARTGNDGLPTAQALARLGLVCWDHDGARTGARYCELAIDRLEAEDVTIYARYDLDPFDALGELVDAAIADGLHADAADWNGRIETLLDVATKTPRVETHRDAFAKRRRRLETAEQV